jgi:hypothetical protein
MTHGDVKVDVHDDVKVEVEVLAMHSLLISTVRIYKSITVQHVLLNTSSSIRAMHTVEGREADEREKKEGRRRRIRV